MPGRSAFVSRDRGTMIVWNYSGEMLASFSDKFFCGTTSTCVVDDDHFLISFNQGIDHTLTHSRSHSHSHSLIHILCVCVCVCVCVRVVCLCDTWLVLMTVVLARYNFDLANLYSQSHSSLCASCGFAQPFNGVGALSVFWTTVSRSRWPTIHLLLVVVTQEPIDWRLEIPSTAVGWMVQEIVAFSC
jgi:hypothetical protein